MNARTAVSTLVAFLVVFQVSRSRDVAAQHLTAGAARRQLWSKDAVLFNLTNVTGRDFFPHSAALASGSSAASQHFTALASTKNTAADVPYYVTKANSLLKAGKLLRFGDVVRIKIDNGAFSSATVIPLVYVGEDAFDSEAPNAPTYSFFIYPYVCGLEINTFPPRFHPQLALRSKQEIKAAKSAGVWTTWTPKNKSLPNLYEIVDSTKRSTAIRWRTSPPSFLYDKPKWWTQGKFSLSIHRAKTTDTYSVLALNQEPDSKTWIAGMQKLQVKERFVLRNEEPTLEEIKEFFRGQDQWLYLAGHFGVFTSSGQEHWILHNRHPKPTITLEFLPDGVLIDHRGQKVMLPKGDPDFQQFDTAVMFWVGCHVHYRPKVVADFRQLFGRHVVSVGWRYQTGWEIADLTCGGIADPKNPYIHKGTPFFARMGHIADPQAVWKAWLSSADEIDWGRNVRNKFSVIDHAGQEHLLKTTPDLPKQGIVDGAKF